MGFAGHRFVGRLHAIHYRETCHLLSWVSAHNNCQIRSVLVQFVWARKGVPGSLLVGLSPLSTVAAVLTDLQSIRLLSGLAIAMAAIQLIHMRSLRHESLRII